MTAESDTVPDAEPIASPRARRIPRLGPLRWWLIGVALVLLVALIGVWTQRKSIAIGYIDKELTRRGVPARYHIADLALGRQRLTNVVIGDPAHPDLVADWVELNTDIGFGSAEVKAVRAGHVRIRGRLIDGKLSLGAIDKLLPAPSGKPFALPALDLTVADARMRLEAPQGVIGLKLSGRGKLSDGFAGHLAAVSERLDLGVCRAGRTAATVRITIADGRPTLVGPIGAALLDCGATHVTNAHADLNATLGDRLDRWQGKAALTVATLRNPAARLERLAGTVSFEGSPSRTSGALDLHSGAFGSADIDGAALSLAGGYRIDTSFIAFQGGVSADRAALAPMWRDRIAALGGAGAGTPFGPLIAQLAKAGVTAGQAMTVNANIDAVQAGAGGRIGVSRLLLASASGAHATLSGGDGIQFGWPSDGLRVDGLLTLSGGGLPEAAIRLAQARARGPITGTAIVQPYAAGGARLALTPVSFTASPSGATRFETRITLSGPLGDGRLDNASLPVAGLWDGAARLRVNPGCAPFGFDRLAISGLVLGRSQLQLCPANGALLQIDGSHLTGGAKIAAPQLAGTLGGTPLTLAAAGSEVRFADQRFTLADLAVRLGQPERFTRLDFKTLEGRIDGAAVAGTFTGTGGQIANVPLLLSDAAGDWRLDKGVLTVAGGTLVSDSAETPRLKPLKSEDVALKLAGNRITATATLANPGTGIKVTDVTIEHDLSRGTGQADLAVPGISFTKTFQPDQLTPLTFGVIAGVDGSVSGDGHIQWSPQGVTSTGTFRTANTDLAAAFGPVTGLSTEIHFTDLLNMISAPDQTAQIAAINPGVPVENGVVHYRTLGSTRVQVDGGSWPFAGGTLALEPTILDFSKDQQRRLTFRVTGMDAAQFLQQFDFKNLDADGIFDGVLPMVFDEKGGRIENGHLTVRQGGGTIAYVGDLSQKDLGFWANMAFQALKSLRYDSLAITMNGPLSGEMVTQVRFAGISQGKGTKTNFIIKRLAKLPFVFNVKITAPFRQLLDSAESLYDPSRLIERNLPTLIKQQNDAATAKPPTAPDSAIQPPESETVP